MNIIYHAVLFNPLQMGWKYSYSFNHIFMCVFGTDFKPTATIW